MRHFLLVVSLSSLLFAGCSKENSISQNNASITTIGPSGGIVDGPDGTELRVPGGAVSEDTEFGIAVAQPGEYPPLDTAWDVSGKVYAYTPHGFRFLTPVIVGLPAGTGTTLIRAEREGGWSELSSNTSADLLEASVTSFSFFASASPRAQVDGGGSTCAGRGPATGPASSASLTGLIEGAVAGSELDASTLRWGYVATKTYGQPMSVLVFTPYDNPCGHYSRGVAKLGASELEVLFMDTAGEPIPLAVGDYEPWQAATAVRETPASSDPALCPDAVGSVNLASVGTPVVTITAVDATHVQGTFTNLPRPTGTVSGTFDLPVCTQVAALDPPRCCVP